MWTCLFDWMYFFVTQTLDKIECRKRKYTKKKDIRTHVTQCQYAFSRTFPRISNGDFMMSPKTIMRRFKGNLYAPLCNQFPTIACLHLCIFHTPHVSQCARLYHSGLSFTTTAQFSQNLSVVGFEFLTASLVCFVFTGS